MEVAKHQCRHAFAQEVGADDEFAFDERDVGDFEGGQRRLDAREGKDGVFVVGLGEQGGDVVLKRVGDAAIDQLDLELTFVMGARFVIKVQFGVGGIEEQIGVENLVGAGVKRFLGHVDTHVLIKLFGDGFV